MHIISLHQPPPCSRQEEGGEVAVDERLLGSLVQDVWDKFSAQRSLLVVRQRHEAEGLWLLQHQQWTDRLKELGEQPLSFHFVGKFRPLTQCCVIT